jgi:molecular chaperone DnaK
VPYPHCYRSIIQRNTPLPVSRTERYSTTFPEQTEASIQIYQGDDDDALKNILVGDFRVEGLTPVRDPNEILCRMRLDLDGILEVTAIEKRTGHARHITIANALRPKSAEEIEAGRKWIQDLYRSREDALDGEWEDASDADVDAERETVAPEADEPGPMRQSVDHAQAVALLERSRRALQQMHPDDREEAIDLHDRIEAAIAAHDHQAVRDASEALKELLFFIEGHA